MAIQLYDSILQIRLIAGRLRQPPPLRRPGARDHPLRGPGTAPRLDPGRGGSQVHELRGQLHGGEEAAPLQELREGVLREVFGQQRAPAQVRARQTRPGLQQMFYIQLNTIYYVITF